MKPFVAVCVGTLFFGLSGCGVDVTKEGEYYYSVSSGTPYTLRVRVAPRGSNVTVEEVTAIIDEQPHAMTAAGSEVWTYDHQTPGAKGFNVSYRVRYHEPYLLVLSNTATVTQPSSGSYQFPILARDSDMDGDGNADRSDACPFNPLDDTSFPCSPGAPAGDLGNIKISQPTSEGLGTIMRDNRGNAMFTQGAVTYYAFLKLDSAKAKIYDWSISGVDVAGKTMRLTDCALIYQDPNDGYQGRFVQVYGANETSACSFAIQSGTDTLVEGDEVLIVVTTATLGSAAGSGVLSGRVTLKPPASDASPDGQNLYRQLTANSPAGYIYLSQPNLLAIESTPGQGSENIGRFAAAGFFVFRP